MLGLLIASSGGLAADHATTAMLMTSTIMDALRKAAKKRSNKELLAREHSSSDESLVIAWDRHSGASSSRGSGKRKRAHTHRPLA